jgi:hypothetical protein
MWFLWKRRQAAKRRREVIARCVVALIKRGVLIDETTGAWDSVEKFLAERDARRAARA